jgi:hypothetical protein
LILEMSFIGLHLDHGSARIRVSFFRLARAAATLVIAYAVTIAISVNAQAKERNQLGVATKPRDKSSSSNISPPSPPAGPLPIPYPNATMRRKAFSNTADKGLNKPNSLAINPALQGNVLQKGTAGGSIGPTKLTPPVTGGQRQ